MKILVTGATGLIGSALTRRLAQAGHTVVAFSRTPEKARHLPAQVFAWQLPAEPPRDAFDGIEAVVHLAGEHIAAGRWTDEQKRQIRDSRIVSTRRLVAALGQLPRRPAAFICASAVGYYGDRGDEQLSEESPPGEGFLSDVCREWEAEAVRAEAFGLRVTRARLGVVLARGGGALEQMLPLFRSGLAGKLGSGRQWFPWIHLDDAVGLLHHAIFHAEASGPVNLVAPGEATNAQFTRALAAALHRPAIFAAPAFALKLALGEMAGMLLASRRVAPLRALAMGYRFLHPTLAEALADLLREN